MGKVSINTKSILIKVAENQTLKKTAIDIANKELKEQRNIFIEEFINHPVSKEIEAGPSIQDNPTGTLGGYGNLFSFIGFKSGSNPIKEVSKYLKSRIRIGKKVNFQIKKNGIFASVNIVTPTKDELEELTPFPDGYDFGSWLLRIERGISGLGYYINKIFKGRSEGGYQSENKVRGGKFKNTSYFSALYNKFLKTLGRDNKFK